MGPGMFKGMERAFAVIVIVPIVLAFCLGRCSSGCEWSLRSPLVRGAK